MYEVTVTRFESRFTVARGDWAECYLAYLIMLELHNCSTEVVNMDHVNV